MAVFRCQRYGCLKLSSLCLRPHRFTLDASRPGNGGKVAVGMEASGHGLSPVSDSAIIREGPHRSEVGYGRRG